jgi:hypothetical protein
MFAQASGASQRIKHVGCSSIGQRGHGAAAARITQSYLYVIVKKKNFRK